MADIRADDKLFGIAAQRTGIGTSELPVLLFRNPNGSGKTVKLKKLIYNNSHTVSSQLRLRVYINPTVSADGTGLSEVALDIGSGNTAGAEAFSSPTISANGTQVLDLIVLGGASAIDEKYDFTEGTQLRANNSILVTAVSDGSNRIANVSLVWEED